MCLKALAHFPACWSCVPVFSAPVIPSVLGVCGPLLTRCLCNKPQWVLVQKIPSMWKFACFCYIFLFCLLDVSDSMPLCTKTRLVTQHDVLNFWLCSCYMFLLCYSAETSFKECVLAHQVKNHFPSPYLLLKAYHWARLLWRYPKVDQK